MSRYNNGPLTPKQIARIERGIAGAHALGGPAYADCKEILGRPLSLGRPPGSKQKQQPTKVEDHQSMPQTWWRGQP